MQFRLIEIGDFLHRLANLQQIAAIERLQCALRQPEKFPGSRFGVLSGPEQEANAADTEQIADELETLTVPGK